MEKLQKIIANIFYSSSSISQTALFFSFIAPKKFCLVYGRSAILEKNCKRWLIKFEKGDFNLDDHPKSGQKRKISLDFLKKVEKQPKTTTRKLAEEFKCDPKTISNGLKKLGKKEN